MGDCMVAFLSVYVFFSVLINVLQRKRKTPRLWLSGPVRDTPLHIAQYPFEIVSQRGVSQGETLIKGEGGIALPQLAMLRHQKPYSAQKGGIAEIVSR